MKIPNWANDLVNQVKMDYQVDKLLTINWRRSHKKKGEVLNWNGENIQTIRPKRVQSSGVTFTGKNIITITAGSSRKDQKLVLLHELAHWLMPNEEHHGKAFWDLAFELYRKYKVPMYYALNREKNYRQEAVYAYRRNRKTLNK